jgi:alpha-tubulin suppressor-like RCC1 family protein
MILKADGGLWATGRNDYSQLGDGTYIDKITPVQVMSGVSAVSTGSQFTMIFKIDGSLWAAGSNTSGQYGNGTTDSSSTPTQVF